MSLVSAAPADKESTERLSYSDPSPKHPKPKRSEDGWVELATPTPASHGEEHIPIADAASFSRLRIDAASGRPIVRAVRVLYKNGKTKLTRVDRILDRKRKQFAVIDLKGAHEIDQVIVITERDSRGTYSVFGEPAHAGVASR